MKKLPLSLACLIALGTAACNTVKGVGRDIQKGGQAIEKAAQ
ncbi:MAG: entericidin A/B family lipoprotein [Rhodocyclaceae bacterium]|nr:entericidin A/B family lipoprotein [Rhodocyclaceae bacterium]